MDIDESIREWNQKNNDSVLYEKEYIVLELKNNLTNKIIKVTLEGDGPTCKDCRDKILHGWYWHQGKMLERKEIKN